MNSPKEFPKNPMYTWYPRRLYPQLATKFDECRNEQKTALATYILDAKFSCQCSICQKEEDLYPIDKDTILGMNNIAFIVLRSLYDHKKRKHLHPYFGEPNEVDEAVEDSEFISESGFSSGSSCTSSSDSEKEDEEALYERYKERKKVLEQRRNEKMDYNSQDSSEGTGISVINIDLGTNLFEEAAKNGNLTNTIWIKVCNSPNSLLYSTWTRPLGLGSIKSFACSIADEGIKEIVDGKFFSSFLTQYENTKNVSAFTQVKNSLRFWIDLEGTMNLITYNKDSWDKQFNQSKGVIFTKFNDTFQKITDAQEKMKQYYSDPQVL